MLARKSDKALHCNPFIAQEAVAPLGKLEYPSILHRLPEMGFSQPEAEGKQQLPQKRRESQPNFGPLPASMAANLFMHHLYGLWCDCDDPD